MKNFYSVVIIGGGPAGTACAIALANQGIENVLVLESGDYSKFAIGESIPPNTKKTLISLGVFKDFMKENQLPCYGVCSYWGADKRGYNDTVLSPFGHGWHLNRVRFNEFLAEQAEKVGAQVEINTAFKKGTLLKNGNYSILYTQQGENKKLTAGFVVDASGSRSVFAKQQGSNPIEGTSLFCLARRFRINESYQMASLTKIEAVENGWWYGANLPNNEMLLAFYTDQETVKENKLHQEKYWFQALKETVSIKNGLDEMTPIDAGVNGFYAPSFCLDVSAGKNWLAIGDAASAYDPITSRGIYKSLTDAEYAAMCIKKFLTAESDSVIAFDTYIKRNYGTYELERLYYYRSEQRWKQSAFWNNLQYKNQDAQENSSLLSMQS